MLTLLSICMIDNHVTRNMLRFMSKYHAKLLIDFFIKKFLKKLVNENVVLPGPCYATVRFLIMSQVLFYSDGDLKIFTECCGMTQLVFLGKTLQILTSLIESCFCCGITQFFAFVSALCN